MLLQIMHMQFNLIITLVGHLSPSQRQIKLFKNSVDLSILQYSFLSIFRTSNLLRMFLMYNMIPCSKTIIKSVSQNLIVLKLNSSVSRTINMMNNDARDIILIYHNFNQSSTMLHIIISILCKFTDRSNIYIAKAHDTVPL